MKRGILLPVCVAGGLATGSAAAWTTHLLLPSPANAAVPEKGPTAFVPTDTILAPLVFEDGRLAGYAQFELKLEVEAGSAERVSERLPFLVHAINLRTYRTPLAAGPDGQIPDLDLFRRLVLAEAGAVFGRRTVRRVAITQARPA